MERGPEEQRDGSPRGRSGSGSPGEATGRRAVRTPVLAVAVVLGLVVVAGVGWLTWQVRVQVVGVARVMRSETVVLGDSITRMSADEVKAATGAEVIAFNSARWVDLVPSAESVARRGHRAPDRVGILLGTNDVFAFDADDAAVDEVLEPLSDVPCVVVLEVPWEGWPGGRLNHRLREEAEGRSNVVVDTRWKVRVIENLRRENGSLLEGDFVHPSPEGRRALAQAFDEAFSERCPDL